MRIVSLIKIIYLISMIIENSFTKEKTNNTDLSLLTNRKVFKLYSPTVQLNGHNGEIFTGKFSNDGLLYCTGGYDRNLMIWETFEEKCRNVTTLTGHSNAILEVTWSKDGYNLYSCSADKTVCVWDVLGSKRVKKFKGHDSFVNSLDVTRRGEGLIVSGGDDSQIIVWDPREKNPSLIEKLKYQITSVRFNLNGDQIFIGGIDNQIKIFDLRKKAIDNILIGHLDTITGLALSNSGTYLLSNSMDNSIRCWDIRPYIQGSRCIKVFQGHSHNFEKNLLRVAWNSDDSLISAGSSDRLVHIWNFNTAAMERKLGGHTGSVNETSFNVNSNIIASCSSDQTSIIGEI